ncbi:hypothetical protein M0805_007787 [Coniferiporia weirii]|nr:hypothetical protein M0805_007787 [Coniferiporia weirii]
MSITNIHGPPSVLLELSVMAARLLPRLELATQLRAFLGLSPSDWTVFSPMTLLWDSLTQGSLLLVLLDLLQRSKASRGESNPTTPTGPTSHKFSSRAELLTVYNRRLKGAGLTNANGVAISELIGGSAEELLKLVKTVLRIVQLLDHHIEGFYDLPPDLPRKRAEAFEKLLANEAEYMGGLNCILVSYNADAAFNQVIPASKIIKCRDLLKAQIDNIRKILIYHEYVSTCLLQFHSGEHWEDLFDLTNNTYADAADAYKYYCDVYLEFFALLESFEAEDDYRSNALEALRLSSPKESPYEYDSLCVVFSTWSSWIQTLFKAMRRRRSLHVGDKIRERVIFWDWSDPYTFGDFLLDDHVPITMALSTFDSLGRPRKTRTTVNCFMFVYKSMLLVCRPRIINQEEKIRTEGYSPSYPIPSWELGPALRSNVIFAVHHLIPTTSIIHHTHYQTDIPGLSNLSITWTKGDSGSEEIVIGITDPNQLRQWVEVLQDACPNRHQLTSGEENLEPSGSMTNKNDRKFIDKEAIRERIMFQKRSLDIALERVFEPLELLSRKTKSDTHLFVLTDRASLSAEARLRRPEELRAALHLPRRHSITRITYDWDALQPSKSFWIHGFQSPESSSPSNDVVPDLTGQVATTDLTPKRQGGFADVWKCKWNSQVGIIDVAVKVINREGKRGRFDAKQEEKTRKRLFHELRMWVRLEHENVVQLLGICRSFDMEPFVSMVSPWYRNGNLHDYIASPRTVLKLSGRMKLLSEVAAGLSYLHSEKIVHGDLHSANVLISERGVACITDFGLSRLVDEETGVSYLRSVEGGAFRWSSPEFCCSTFSDVYAYGCIILEVLSGKIPYYNLLRNQVLQELGQKRVPKRPPNTPYLTDGMWKVTNECWRDPHTNRPTAADLNSRMLLLYYRCLGSHPV